MAINRNFYRGLNEPLHQWQSRMRGRTQQKRSVSLADTTSPIFHRIHHHVHEGTNWRHSNCLPCLVIYKYHNTTGAVHLTCINTLMYTQIQLAARKKGTWSDMQETLFSQNITPSQLLPCSPPSSLLFLLWFYVMTGDIRVKQDQETCDVAEVSYPTVEARPSRGPSGRKGIYQKLSKWNHAYRM